MVLHIFVFRPVQKGHLQGNAGGRHFVEFENALRSQFTAAKSTIRLYNTRVAFSYLLKFFFDYQTFQQKASDHSNRLAFPIQDTLSSFFPVCTVTALQRSTSTSFLAMQYFLQLWFTMSWLI